MSKTNPKVHPLQGPKPPTEEEIKQQQIRALHQQRCGMAQAFAVNILHAIPITDLTANFSPKDVAHFACVLADAMMEEFYGPKEESNGTEE